MACSSAPLLATKTREQELSIVDLPRRLGLGKSWPRSRSDSNRISLCGACKIPCFFVCIRPPEGIGAQNFGSVSVLTVSRRTGHGRMTNELSLTVVKVCGSWKAVSLRRHEKHGLATNELAKLSVPAMNGSVSQSHFLLVNCGALFAPLCGNTLVCAESSLGSPQGRVLSAPRSAATVRAVLQFAPERGAHFDVGRRIIVQDWLMIGFVFALLLRPACTTLGIRSKAWRSQHHPCGDEPNEGS